MPFEIKHGQRRTRLYSEWIQMKTRCYNPNFEHYNHYGGKGITVSSEWIDSFENFMEWANRNGYSDKLTLDRINNDGNYNRENCRWVTMTAQVRNRSNTVHLVHNGIKKTLIEWCIIHNVKYKLAHQRYKKGWNFERIFGI